jgi:hypothetical protein
MKNTNALVRGGTVLLLSAMMFGCTEPGKPPANPSPDAPRPADPQATTSVASDALAPVEVPLEERRATLVPEKNCNLERADNKVFTGAPIDVSKASGQVRVSGWLANGQTASVPAQAELRLVSSTDNRAWKVGVNTGGKRDDVVKLLGGDPGYAGSGFVASVSVSNLPVGQYRMYAVFNEGDSLKVCDNGRSILLGE